MFRDTRRTTNYMTTNMIIKKYNNKGVSPLVISIISIDDCSLTRNNIVVKAAFSCVQARLPQYEHDYHSVTPSMASLAGEKPVVAQATVVPVQVDQQQVLQQQLLQRQAVEARTRNFLQSYGWPPFLVETLIKHNKEIWKRFFIIDDSGSMNSNDGTIIRGKKARTCSRWSEQKDALLFHAELAYKSLSPANFGS